MVHVLLTILVPLDVYILELLRLTSISIPHPVSPERPFQVPPLSWVSYDTI